MMMAPVSALAQEETDWDKYSVLTEKVLMLTGDVQTSLSADDQQYFFNMAAMGRFNWDIKESDPNSAAVEAWCKKSVKDTQVRRDNTDEYGEAEITLKAMVERCSQVFRMALKVSHSCKMVVKGKKKKKRYMKCTVKSTMAFTKFKASMKTGKFAYTVDSKFGKKGTKTLKSKSSSSKRITKKVSQAKAQRKALRSAAKGAGFGHKKAIREIKDFQIHAPIVRVKDGHADSCLGKDTVELDLPFHVVFKGKSGEQRKGWVKARRIYDGCTMTPSMLEEKKKGKKFKLRPMESQIIIGGSDVKKGYTLWEMPSSGLNLEFHGGMMPQIGSFNHTFGGGMGVEYNMAAATGISEFYTFTRIDLGFVSDTDPLEKMFIKGYDQISAIEFEPAIVAQMDVGIFKRVYMRRLFMDFGVAASASYYLLELKGGQSDNVEIKVIGVGGGAHFGLGFQITPRLMVRALGAFKYSLLLPMVTIADQDIDPDNKSAIEPEMGVHANFGFIYSI